MKTSKQLKKYRFKAVKVLLRLFYLILGPEVVHCLLAWTCTLSARIRQRPASWKLSTRATPSFWWPKTTLVWPQSTAGRLKLARFRSCSPRLQSPLPPASVPLLLWQHLLPRHHYLIRSASIQYPVVEWFRLSGHRFSSCTVWILKAREQSACINSLLFQDEKCLTIITYATNDFCGSDWSIWVVKKAGNFNF